MAFRPCVAAADCRFTFYCGRLRKRDYDYDFALLLVRFCRSPEPRHGSGADTDIPGAATRLATRPSEDFYLVGGPLELRARLRLRPGPQSPAFYSIEHRPWWSSVIEVRTQLLLDNFEGDPKHVGRLKRGIVQPSLYGAAELNWWRLHFAPGFGILVGDREAHVDLTLRTSVQFMDRIFGDAASIT